MIPNKNNDTITVRHIKTADQAHEAHLKEVRNVHDGALSHKRLVANARQDSVGKSVNKHPLQSKDAVKDSLPQYTKRAKNMSKENKHSAFQVQTFFSNTPYYHPELNGKRPGVSGDPLPYTVAGDNLLTALLLAFFLLGCLSFARSRQFIIRQGKSFFKLKRSRPGSMTETSSEIRFQLFMVLQTALLLGLVSFFYISDTVGRDFITDQYTVIGLLGGVVAVYYLLKLMMYNIVGWLFFDSSQTADWNKSFLFLTTSQGVVVFPAVMLRAYFGLSINYILGYVLGIILLGKLLSFYKSFLIFFRQTNAYLQIILYFCTLEIAPLFALWGILVLVGNYLKVNI